MESQQLKQLSFSITVRKNKLQNFLKNEKYYISGPFLPEFGQNCIFHKNWVLSLLRTYSLLTSFKKSEKTKKSVLRKTLN